MGFEDHPGDGSSGPKAKGSGREQKEETAEQGTRVFRGRRPEKKGNSGPASTPQLGAGLGLRVVLLGL